MKSRAGLLIAASAVLVSAQAASCHRDSPHADASVMSDGGADAGIPHLPVYVMAGQSNMVGTGKNTELLPGDEKPVPGVSIYYNAGVHPNTHTKRWLPLGPGFGATDDNFGPELSFGRAMTDGRPGAKIAIIKLAEGGTGLHDRWKSGTGDLYLLLVAEVKARMAELAGENPRIDGFVWMQGENDASKEDTAADYRRNLADFILSLRAEIGAPYLPIVAGLISTDAGWPYAAAVRAATSLVASRLGRMAVVETDDLPVYPADPAHLTSSGDWQLGVRFAASISAGSNH